MKHTQSLHGSFSLSRLRIHERQFPGGLVVGTLPSNEGDAGSILGQGAKIPHVLWPKNKIKHKTEAIL